MSRRVLIADDDPGVRTSLAEALREVGIDVTIAEDGARALGLVGAVKPDVVLCDIRMPEMDGQELLLLLRERMPSVAVILMTAFDDMPTVVQAMRGGAVEFLVKPVDLDRLVSVVERALEDQRLRHRRGDGASESVARLGELVGHDPTMIEVYKLVGQASRSRATVLIRGESGTGKELVARAIHASSADAAEPFVTFNCAALSLGSPDVRRLGAPGRGTIFLDEIGDTSLEFQSKLLGVEIEARIIAATHRNIEELVAAGRFRDDLYYRLRVVEIVLPRLRDRPGDVPLLAEHMLHRAAASFGGVVPVLSREALDRLIAHDWPGNVRELENCLMRAVVVAAGQVIRPEHLTLASPRSGHGGPLSTLEQVERDQVVRVLAATEGHKTRAAEILGVSRPRLNRLIEKYGLES